MYLTLSRRRLASSSTNEATLVSNAAFSVRKRRLAAEMRAACEAARLRARARAASELGERGAAAEPPVRREVE